ncbi:unnamed protein product [Cylindrotheca closterium]|uniref:Uncharacterized protein n=1 Tax=Cylindrotheca closterium TaxID=2856 RepID=A0AAD2CJB0_9STRA|nr:unnamed protein product [Cylindrotheca closterium]
MRTIQLFNSEAQANYKKAGRVAMKNAEEDDIIPKGQCGSRKQHQSIDLALSKRLIWDSIILERRSSGWISNDAKSCFDRIVHWVAKTALRRFGLPVTVTNLMFDILAKAKHRVRTGFGDSDRTFGPTGDVPFQGCGQGNGAGPCIWVAISAILIDAMEAEGFGYKSRTALTNEEFFASCFCFVDDTDVMESNDNVETTGEDLLPSVQSALDLWLGSISATGGAIYPAKSFWWLIDFKWRPSSGTRVFRRKAEMPGKLTLQDPTGPWATLRRLQPDEAERTLGVMMAPLETGTAQHLALREKAKNWAAKFRPQHLLRYDVLPLLKATALKTLEDWVIEKEKKKAECFVPVGTVPSEGHGSMPSAKEQQEAEGFVPVGTVPREGQGGMPSAEEQQEAECFVPVGTSAIDLSSKTGSSNLQIMYPAQKYSYNPPHESFSPQDEQNLHSST